MASFTVAKAPVAAPKAFKGLSKAAPKPAAKVANVSKANEMMVWTPNNNKCALARLPFSTCQQPAPQCFAPMQPYAQCFTNTSHRTVLGYLQCSLVRSRDGGAGLGVRQRVSVMMLFVCLAASAFAHSEHTLPMMHSLKSVLACDNVVEAAIRLLLLLSLHPGVSHLRVHQQRTAWDVHT